MSFQSRNQNKTLKYSVMIARLIVGVVFIISGLVKTIDPIGFGYKLEEYFSESVLNLPFLSPYALAFSVFFVIFEVVLGLLLLLGLYRRFTVYNLLAMIIVFTFLTFYAAYYDKVRDCGCFGDFIKLKPWETFYKDIVLLILILILVVGMRYIHPISKNHKLLKIIALIGTLLTCWIAYEGIFNLPLVDFRPYAEGKDLKEGRKTAEELGLKPPTYATMYTLQHAKTHQEKVIDDKEYLDSGIWEDTLWVIDNSKTKSIIKEEGYIPPIPAEFSIDCSTGNKTEEVLNADKMVVITVLHVKELGIEQQAKLKKFVNELNKKRIKNTVIGDSPTLSGLTLCTMDDKVIKAINRSEVGIMVLEKGVVKKKYAYSDFPTVNEIIKK